MQLAKEIITKVDSEIEAYDDNLLKVYNRTYTMLHKEYPNGYFGYMANKSKQELEKRGLEP